MIVLVSSVMINRLVNVVVMVGFFFCFDMFCNVYGGIVIVVFVY